MKIWLVIGVLFLLPFLAFCQEKEKERAGFRSIVAIGAIGGAERTNFLCQYSAGLRFDRYFAGVGIGFDSYRFNTIPVFADWRINFTNKKVLFVYGNIGTNITIGSKNYKEDFQTTKIRPGLYTDAGFGYRIQLPKSNVISLSVGHSFKKLTQEQTFTYQCGLVPCEPTTDTYNYKFNRLIVKAGWEFGK
ncbi:MAG: hypothetical protein ABIR18_07980 [Chitinophagaceae bacterium]